MPFPLFHGPRCAALLSAAMLAGTGFSLAEESLAPRVDRFIAAKAEAAQQPLAPPADDAAFFRRVWLDFAGTIPTAAETRAFLANPAADKRTKLIDQLI